MMVPEGWKNQKLKISWWPNITKNILARKAKGAGIVDQIMGKLRGTLYGPYYFEVGLILRESMLINGILRLWDRTAWAGGWEFSENIPRGWKRMLKRDVILGNRNNSNQVHNIRTYWKKVVNKFLKIQMEKQSKKDWINSVVKDLLLEISLSADEIRVLSTAQFKILWTKVLWRKHLSTSTKPN